MKASKNAYELIKRFEGVRNVAYQCQAGVWTIGYGHTKNVKRGNVITTRQAEDLLVEDVREFEKELNTLFRSGYFNQNQFDALISFVFNVGITNFRSSTLYKRVLKTTPYDPQVLKTWWTCWNKVTDQNGNKVTSNGLVKRRQAELDLFLKNNA